MPKARERFILPSCLADRHADRLGFLIGFDHETPSVIAEVPHLSLSLILDGVEIAGSDGGLDVDR